MVSSNNWNSLAAKQALIDLNRKWVCKHWMVDYGYSNSIVEELRAYSMKVAAQLGDMHPDSQLKPIEFDPIEFGSLITITDPFTKEEVKKTTRSFMVQQLARLFEVVNGADVPIKFSRTDKDLIDSS